MAKEKNTSLDRNKGNSLLEAVREIKIASAERSDVVVEMKEADRARLEILAQELEPVFSEVPLDDARFDFAISSGLQPRLWIDATAHVMMGKDRRQYRFVRDTRLGRIVLAESNKTGPIVESVTKYIAERIYDLELALAGDDITYRAGVAQRSSEEEPVEHNDNSEENTDAEVSVSKTESDNQLAAEKVVMGAHDRESKIEPSKIGWIILGLFVLGGAFLLMFREQIFSTIT